jgi:hypothetical protein
MSGRDDETLATELAMVLLDDPIDPGGAGAQMVEQAVLVERRPVGRQVEEVFRKEPIERVDVAGGEGGSETRFGVFDRGRVRFGSQLLDVPATEQRGEAERDEDEEAAPTRSPRAFAGSIEGLDPERRTIRVRQAPDPGSRSRSHRGSP